MSRYQHTKGQIKDNAIEALLHDPPFRQRIEKCLNGIVFNLSFSCADSGS